LINSSNPGRKTIESCAYCPQPATTRDHVIPACFFPDPLPTDLITVPCCLECNGKFSFDDLWARNLIAMRQDVDIQPRLDGLRRKMFINLAKPGSRKLNAMLARLTRRRDVRLRSGVIMPDQYVVDVDRPRLVRWSQRVFCGLYNHEHGYPMPPEMMITVGFGEDFPEFVTECVSWMQSRPLRTSGDGIVAYKWVACSERPEASVWGLELYRCMFLLGFIHPPISDEERLAVDRELKTSRAGQVPDSLLLAWRPSGHRIRHQVRIASP
jgi:hypothetical protein